MRCKHTCIDMVEPDWRYPTSDGRDGYGQLHVMANMHHWHYRYCILQVPPVPGPLCGAVPPVPTPLCHQSLARCATSPWPAVRGSATSPYPAVPSVPGPLCHPIKQYTWAVNLWNIMNLIGPTASLWIKLHLSLRNPNVTCTCVQVLPAVYALLGMMDELTGCLVGIVYSQEAAYDATYPI